MTETVVEELVQLRRLLALALSDAPDCDVTPGAAELRRKFQEAAMRRLDLAAERHEVSRPMQEQREGS